MSKVTLSREEYEEMVEQYKDMECKNDRLVDDNNKMDDEIEQLREEISQLKQKEKGYIIEFDKLCRDAFVLKVESERLRRALQKCSPFSAGYCKFCMIDSLTEEHKPECEYVRLIGGTK